MYATHDTGFSWKKVHLGSDNFPVSVLTMEPAHPYSFYAGSLTHHGMYVSGDAGHTWRRIDQDMSYNHIWTIAVAPSQRGKMYVGTSGGGVYRFHPK